MSFWAIESLCLNFAAGQINTAPSGARAAGLSHSSIAFNDSWSCINNQAGLAYVTNVTINFFIENRFLLKELSQRDIIAVVPVRAGALGASIRYFGYSLDYNVKYGLAYGIKLFSWVSAGAQIHINQSYIDDGYGIVNTLSGEVGLLFNPTKKLFLGIHWTHPSLDDKADDLKTHEKGILRVGMAYYLSLNAIFVFETETWQNNFPIIKGGIEVPFKNQIFLRCGYATGYGEYSLGVGYRHKGFLGDVAFSMHPALGVSPKLSLGYEF